MVRVHEANELAALRNFRAVSITARNLSRNQPFPVFEVGLVAVAAGMIGAASLRMQHVREVRARRRRRRDWNRLR